MVSAPELNFEWPKQADLDDLGGADSIRLRAFYFMSVDEDYQPVSRVTCIYQNGAKSPNIHATKIKVRHERQGQVTFDTDRPVRSIRASVYAQHKIPAIGFFDKDGEEITSYDPEGYGFEVNAVERTLKSSEELVGVYGVTDAQKWFTSLGFIVMRKVMPDQDVNESQTSLRSSTVLKEEPTLDRDAVD